MTKPPRIDVFISSTSIDLPEHRAGVAFKPHDLRRTFITEALAGGSPVHQIQAQVGHARGETTLGYARDRRPPRPEGNKAVLWAVKPPAVLEEKIMSVPAVLICMLIVALLAGLSELPEREPARLILLGLGGLALLAVPIVDAILARARKNPKA